MFRRFILATWLCFIPATCLAQAVSQDLAPQQNPGGSDPKTLQVLQPANPSSVLQGAPPPTEAADPQKLTPQQSTDQALTLLKSDFENRPAQPSSSSNLNRLITAAVVILGAVLLALLWLHRRRVNQLLASTALGKRLPFQRTRRNSYK